MNVKIIIKGSKKESEEASVFADLIKQIILLCCNIINISPELIDNIIVTDEENYGIAIDSLKSGEKYTKTDISLGVAKTISKNVNNEKTVSSIVFRFEYFQQIIEAYDLSKNINEWKLNDRYAIYLILHELGHCIDNNLRKSCDYVSLAGNNGFEIQQVAKYYYNILLSEFAACAHAAKSMTADLYLHELHGTQSSIFDLLENINNEKKLYDGDMKKLSHLAFFASGGFWFILVQYAKLQGIRLENKNLSKLPIDTWQCKNKMISDLLIYYFEILDGLWNKYPDWEDTPDDNILNIWYDLSLELGFKFVKTDEGDGVYFNIQ